MRKVPRYLLFPASTPIHVVSQQMRQDRCGRTWYIVFRLPVSHPVGHKVGEDDHVHPNGGIIQQPREPIQLLLAVAVIIARQGGSPTDAGINK